MICLKHSPKPKLRWVCSLVFTLVSTTSYSLAQVQFVQFSGANLKDTATITFRFKIEEGYHIQANEVLESHLLATRLQVQLPNKASICFLEYPKAKNWRIGEGRPLRVFGGIVEVIAHIDTDQIIKGQCIQGQLHYQTCDHQKCYFPRVLDFEYVLN